MLCTLEFILCYKPEFDGFSVEKIIVFLFINHLNTLAIRRGRCPHRPDNMICLYPKTPKINLRTFELLSRCDRFPGQMKASAPTHRICHPERSEGSQPQKKIRFKEILRLRLRMTKSGGRHASHPIQKYAYMCFIPLSLTLAATVRR